MGSDLSLSFHRLFRDNGLLSSGYSQACLVAKAGLETLILIACICKISTLVLQGQEDTIFVASLIYIACCRVSQGYKTTQLTKFLVFLRAHAHCSCSFPDTSNTKKKCLTSELFCLTRISPFPQSMDFPLLCTHMNSRCLVIGIAQTCF